MSSPMEDEPANASLPSGCTTRSLADESAPTQIAEARVDAKSSD